MKFVDSRFKFNEDRIFSLLYSADVSDIIKYLKSCGFSKIVGYLKKSNKITVPKVRVDILLSYQEFDILKSIIEKVNISFRWEISIFYLFGREYNKEAIPELIQALYEIINNTKNFKNIKLVLEFTPKSYDRNLAKSPYHDLVYLYHVTERTSSKNILKQGLIPTDDSRTEFIYPVCSHLLRYLGYLVKYDSFKGLVPAIALNLKDPVLLKIGPLTALNQYIFFIDPFSMLDGVVTPNIIPPNLIEVVDPNDYAKEFRAASINHSKEMWEHKTFSKLDSGINSPDIDKLVNYQD